MSVVSSSPIRIFLIENHEVMRTGLRLLLENHSGFQVVGEAANRSDALTGVTREQPNVIVLGLKLGADNATDFLPELLTAAVTARVLVLTGVYDSELHRRAVSLSAVGVVFKEQAATVLLRAIEKVHAGEVWLERSMIANVLGEITRRKRSGPIDLEAAKVATLTAREREVIALIGKGLRNKQIAKSLYISETTVRHHLTSVFSKLDVHARLELMIYAYQHGLASIPR